MTRIRALGITVAALTLSFAFLGTASAQTKPDPAAPARTEPPQQFRASQFNGDVTVRGSISAESLRLTPKTADFVFRDGYPLRSLGEVERFVQANGHLPEIPSAQEMLAHGVAVETLNGLYLQKIEELTLYLIAQERDLARLREQVSGLLASRDAAGATPAAEGRHPR